MSDHIKVPPTKPKELIRNPQDFWGGLVLLCVALLGLWAGWNLPGMHGFAFGPGTAPRMFAVILGVLGGAIMVNGLITRSQAFEGYTWRGPLFITASVLTFAFTIRPLGLVISSFVTIMLAAAATPEVRWRETVVLAAGLTLFCALLFPYGLNLPLQLWPRF